MEMFNKVYAKDMDVALSFGKVDGAWKMTPQRNHDNCFATFV